MPDRSYLKSASALSIALGLAAAPLAAQQADTPAGLLNTYPALSSIEDRSCLNTLAEYEAEAGSGALAPVIQGEIAPEAIEDTDENLLRCLRVAADAGTGGPQAPADAAAVPEVGEEPEVAEAEPAAPAQEPDMETAAPAEADVPEVPAAEAVEAPQTPDTAPETPPIAEDTAETDAEPVEEAEAPDETEMAPEPETVAEEAAAPEIAEDTAEAVTLPDAVVTAEPEALGEEAEIPEPVEDPAEAEIESEAEMTPEPEAVEREDVAVDAEPEAPVEAEPETAEVPEPMIEEAPIDDDAVVEAPMEPEETMPETAEDETRPALEIEQEAVQEDTAALTDAVNQAVAAAAAATEDISEAEEVETTVVTEETARRSDEEFTAAPQVRDGRGLDLGQIAAGVIGGILLNELLGATEQVVTNTGDRVVVRRGEGDYYVLKDENVLLRQPGSEIETYRYSDGSTRQVVTREDGTQVITVRAADGQPLRRIRVLPDGRQIVLFDDTGPIEPVFLEDLPPVRAESVEFTGDMDAEALRRALAAEEADLADRRFSLRQVRDLRTVRNLVPTLQIETINFETDSAAIRASQAEALAEIGNAMRRMIDENPSEVFLVEGHTDAVGPAAYNLALSDRRAESVALALTEYFDVPPENMVVQGYGESDLRVPTTAAEPRNRRAAVRRITPLLSGASL